MRVQFASLGKSPDVVLNALRHVPMDEIHLFTDSDDSPELASIKKFYENDPLRIKVYNHIIDKFDLMNCLLNMIEGIKKVRKKYQSDPKLKITLNMTGGTKIMTSALLLVGYMTASPVFYLKKLREDDGIGELIWVPMPRVSTRDFRDTRLKIIKTLGEINRPISLSLLKKETGLRTVQSMTRYIKEFENQDLIESDYQGKERLVSLTDTGKVLVALMEN